MRGDRCSIRNVAIALEQSGFSEIAARLVHLHRLADEDPEEPGISIGSLRGLVSFLQHEPRLPSPRIGVGPTGVMQAEWRVADDGMLALKFLPSKFIRFAAISRGAQLGRKRRRSSGILPASEVWERIRPSRSSSSDLLIERQDHP